MKNNSTTLVKVLIYIVLVVVLWILFLMVSAIITTDGEGSEIPLIWGQLSGLAAVIVGAIIFLFASLNRASSQLHTIKANLSSLQIMQNKRKRLLHDMEQVIIKHAMVRDKNSNKETKEEMSESIKYEYKSTNSIKTYIETHPDILNQELVDKLLNQLVQQEEEIASQKYGVNGIILNYNTQISSFPVSMFRKLRGLELQDYYEEDSDESVDISQIEFE